jgi:hypothetical protein
LVIRVPQTTGVENNLGMVVRFESNVANTRCESGNSVVVGCLSTLDQQIFTVCGSDGYRLERRSSFGLSIDPAARITVPALKILASPVEYCEPQVRSDYLMLHILNKMIDE